MDCIFCKIVSGEIPSKKVYENNSTIAFLDINPANKGHVLVAPKKHTETIMDTEDDELRDVITSVKIMAERIKSNLDSEGVNVIQNNGVPAGQIVNHMHFHVIPRHKGDNVIITYQRQQMTEEELNEVQKILSSSNFSKAVSNAEKKDEWDFEI